MVLGDALEWAGKSGADVLLVETAAVPALFSVRGWRAGSGGAGSDEWDEPAAQGGPMLSLADVAVVTKIDRVSQAEREVFRAVSRTQLRA